MKIKNIDKINIKCALLAVLILFCTASPSNALMFRLDPASKSVGINEMISLDLWMDSIGDPTIGGSLDISYDTVILQFVSFNLDAAFPDDPDFRRIPSSWTGGSDALAFGNFFGIEGNLKVGTILFDAVSMGVTNVINFENTGGLGGFVSSARRLPDNLLQFPTFTGTQITVGPTLLPEPSATVILIAGLGIIGFYRKKRCKN